jgi:hypothetical protein
MLAGRVDVGNQERAFQHVNETGTLCFGQGSGGTARRFWLGFLAKTERNVGFDGRKTHVNEVV